LENDIYIWERFKAGDKSALSYVYFQYFQLLYQYGIRIKNNPEFIKDCIQDVFIKLIQAGENLGTVDNIKFYLFRALKNTIYKEIDKSKRVEIVEFIPLKFDSPFSIEEEFEENKNTSDRGKALLNALHSLSDRQREIIYLRYECELNYEQICELMCLKNDSARKLVYRAIKALKVIIENQVQLPLLLLIQYSKRICSVT
jgi:RNA polymerase sigma factor (sigma-70 family)